MAYMSTTFLGTLLPPCFLSFFPFAFFFATVTLFTYHWNFALLLPILPYLILFYFFFCFEVVDLQALLFANFCELERDLLHSSLPTVDSPSDYLFCPSILRLKETLFHYRLLRDYVPIQVLEQLISSWNGAKEKKDIFDCKDQL